MMKPLILQVVSDDPHYLGMATDNQDRHISYCEKWGFDYKLDQWENLPHGWSRMASIQRHLKSADHDFIVYLDADAAIINHTRDLREALPRWAHIGMSIHSCPYPPNPFWHFNTGTMFVKRGARTGEFFDFLMGSMGLEGDDGEVLNEQSVINAMALRPHFQEGIRVLDYRWSTNMPDTGEMEQSAAYIGTWHGSRDPETRREKMREALENFPYA